MKNATKKLPTPKSDTQKKARRNSRPIRLSNEVLDVLRRKKRRGESWDSLLRRLFGLPDKKGKPQPVRKIFVLPSDLTAFDNLAEANGEAVLRAVRARKRKTEAPVPFIEAK